jgi:hypothetical protein
MREIRSFVVRIYRRDKRGVAGVVEDVRTGCFHSFRSAPDLWAIVATPDPERPHEEEPQ